MKKILAIILVIAALSTMSLTAFAVVSPTAEAKLKVEGWTYASGALLRIGAAHGKDNGDGTWTFTRSTPQSQYEFEGWEIHDWANNPAKSGVNYEIVSGTLTGDTITIRPLSDLKVYEMYHTRAAGYTDDGGTSPATGSNLLALGTILLLSMSVAYVAKKRLA